MESGDIIHCISFYILTIHRFCEAIRRRIHHSVHFGSNYIDLNVLILRRDQNIPSSKRNHRRRMWNMLWRKMTSKNKNKIILRLPHVYVQASIMRMLEKRDGMHAASGSDAWRGGDGENITKHKNNNKRKSVRTTARRENETADTGSWSHTTRSEAKRH